jgi:hypothetical protein
MDSHILGAVTTDPFGNVIVAGSFSGIERFVSTILTSDGEYDIFLLKAKRC